MRRSWMVVSWVLVALIGRSAEVEAGTDEPVLVAIERNAETAFFALRTESDERGDSAAPSSDDPVVPGTRPSAFGACALTRSHEGGSWALQLDIELPLEGTRVLHVELSDAEAQDCIWRELRAGSGRTIRFEVKPEGTEATEWSPGGTKRRSVWPGQRGLGLLELIELVRLDSPARIPSKARWIDPLAGDLVPVVLTVERRGSVRSVDVHTATGDRVAHLSFEGRELAELTWQSGGLIAERVSAEAHKRLIADRRRLAARSARTE